MIDLNKPKFEGLERQLYFVTLNDFKPSGIIITPIKNWNFIAENGGLRTIIKEKGLDYDLTFESRCLRSIIGTNILFSHVHKNMKMVKRWKKIGEFLGKNIPNYHEKTA